MQVLRAEQTDHYVCIPNDAEVKLLTRACAWAAWSDVPQALSTLDLDEVTYTSLDTVSSET